ncbi:hypothetical protein [uncultured Kordia sp.]|uniref:hypothetical protein n=1 Tax=uncultured Kordia sp. TaxID=507699 RepID=UPI00262380D0|nr:hypothetical protein [uncultured Kordia sp.]
MKKNILNIGTVLNKEEQRKINGGDGLTNLQEYCASLSIVYHSLTNDPEGDGISPENDSLATQTLIQWNKHCIGVN